MSAAVMPTSGDNTQSYLASDINFWENKAYSSTVKRLENVYKLCDTMCTMLHERDEVERLYSSRLRKWSNKWSDYITNNLEYGGCKTVWYSFCTEAQEMADLHEEIGSNLVSDVSAEIKEWQKKHFYKMKFPPGRLREVHELEKSFHSAQQPWAQLLESVRDTQKSFYSACKDLQTVDAQLRQCEAQLLKETPRGTTLPASTDGETQNTTQSTRRQTSCPCGKVKQALEQNLEKAKQVQMRKREAYETAVNRLQNDEPRYKREMTYVFHSAQEKEKEKILFFQSMFEKFHQVLAQCYSPRVPQIYARLFDSIATIDPKYDLDWWTAHYGTDKELYCPQFEEYDPNAKLTKGGLFRSSKPSAQSRSVQRLSIVVMTGNPAATVATSTMDESFRSSVNTEAPPFEGGDDNYHREDASAPNNIIIVSGAHSGSHPALNHINPETIAAICQVRAIYDFTPVESDELSLHEGDILDKVENEDEQGWCTGRKNGRIGYYPATYVETVS